MSIIKFLIFVLEPGALHTDANGGDGCPCHLFCKWFNTLGSAYNEFGYN